MKNPKFKKAAMVLIVQCLASAPAFASMSDCRNPVTITLDQNVKMRFCRIPAGSALIGSDFVDPYVKKMFPDRTSDATPVFRRYFRSFEMAQFPVTQAQYKSVLLDTPWMSAVHAANMPIRAGDNFPAVEVDYYQAKEFARVLSLMDRSATYRLPTEAEYEYAARGGTTTDYYWGDHPDPRFAYSDESTRDGSYPRDVTTCPDAALDRKAPGYCANNFGLMHMEGNVAEWVEDAWTSYLNLSTDGDKAFEGDEGSERVTRGGTFRDSVMDMQPSFRDANDPDLRIDSVGFRIVRIHKDQRREK